jgi:hypothetical protein
LCRDEVPSSELILFNHQLVLLARVSLAFFFAVVPVVVAIPNMERQRLGSNFTTATNTLNNRIVGRAILKESR